MTAEAPSVTAQRVALRTNYWITLACLKIRSQLQSLETKRLRS